MHQHLTAVAPRRLGETELSGVSLARVCRCHFGADSDDDATWDACHVESSETAAGDDGRTDDGRAEELFAREGGRAGAMSAFPDFKQWEKESHGISVTRVRNVVRARARNSVRIVSERAGTMQSQLEF